jgi:hypothetical protein
MQQAQKAWNIATVLPGLLLVLVACSQIYLTQARELTPSKGGGFGMFAVTDIRNARTWSVDCLTVDGKPCRVLIARGEGSVGQWLADAFRTMPDARARARAADRIFAWSYVPASYSETVATSKLTGVESLFPPGWRDAPLYRPLTAEDSARGIVPVKLKAIRFQAWRLAFDHAGRELRCERIGEPESRGEW